MDQKQKVYQFLNSKEISFQVIDHPAVFTIDEMEQLTEIENKKDVVKNLFLRDGKGKRHFLVVMCHNKKADLKEIRSQLGCSSLSFASEDSLHKCLKLTKGAVTPMGILNDEACHVEVVFDKDLQEKKRMGIHPNDNSATIMISFSDLYRVILDHGNQVFFIKI